MIPHTPLDAVRLSPAAQRALGPGPGRTMAARGLSARVASSAALAISVLIAVLTTWYYRLYVHAPVSAGYGFYIGAAVTCLAIVLSVWAMVAAWSAVGRRP